MHRSGMHCPLCVFLQHPALCFGYMFFGTRSLFIYCFCNAWLTAVCLSNVLIGKVAECALPLQTQPGVYWQDTVHSSFLCNGIEALGRGRAELTEPFLIMLFL